MAAIKNWTHAELVQLREMYEQGHTQKEIGEALHINGKTVNDRLSKMGISPQWVGSHVRHPVTDEQLRILEEAYLANNCFVIAAARAAHVSTARAKLLLQDMGHDTPEEHAIREKARYMKSAKTRVERSGKKAKSNFYPQKIKTGMRSGACKSYTLTPEELDKVRARCGAVRQEKRKASAVEKVLTEFGYMGGKRQ